MLSGSFISPSLHLDKLESLLTRMLWPKFVWNWPSCYRVDDDNVKFFTDGQQAIRKAQLSYQLWWAKYYRKNSAFNIVARYRSPCSKVVRAKIRLTFCSLLSANMVSSCEQNTFEQNVDKQASCDINIRYIRSDI